METTLIEDARAARERAAVCDREGRGLLIARGADRQAFLHAMLSNAIAGVPAGQGCRAELLDDRGHVVADFRVLVLADEVRLDCEDAAIAEKARATLDRFVIMDDVTLIDASAASAVLTVSGPEAADVLARAGAGPLPTTRWSSLPATIGGAAVHVVRSRWTGGNDFDVFAPSAARDAVRATLVSAGARLVSKDAFEALRVEAGVARQATELDDVLALEARLAPEAVSFTKGCYLGQEVMARIDARGHVNRTLVGLTLGGDAPAPRGAILRAAGKDVGRVTSSVVSPTLGKPIALAYLRHEHAKPGSTVTVVADGTGRAATVVELPFVGR